MAIINHRHRIAYFPIHKCASTVIKKALFLIETGRPFASKELGGATVHQVYRFVPETETERWHNYLTEYLTLAVVRDPIKRAISAYADRVVVRKCLEEDKTSRELKGLALPVAPTLEEFFKNLAGYAAASNAVRRHIRPQSKYIGPIFGKIAHIVPIEHMAEAESLLTQASGSRVVLTPSKKASPRIGVSDLSDRALQLAGEFYSDDYRMLADFYQPLG